MTNTYRAGWLVAARLFFAALVAVATFMSLNAFAATYYVRADGGTAAQCNGTADAPASASPNCAWSSPLQALPPTLPNYPYPAKIKGGDTLVIGPGAYRIGWTAGSYDDAHYGDNCAVLYAPACTMQKVPSGTPAQPTRIVGAGWDTGCSAPPQLYGVNGINQIFDLDGASNVVIACLDLTDHSNCTIDYRPNPAFSCDHKWRAAASAPYGDWAGKGIYARDSSNVTLQDLNIHGFADQGVQAGRISDWTVTRVKVRGNGMAGWNGDLGGNNHNSTNSGTLTFTDLAILWNGCAEDYPNAAKIINCFGQNEGGYGDGFSEAWTGGHYVFIRPNVQYNTQDGLDLLYANGTGSITVDHGYFYGNAGNDLKTSGPATITNSVFVAYCNVMQKSGMPIAGDGSSGTSGTMCRAGAGEVSDFTGPGQTVTFAHNTVTGNPGCLFGGDPEPMSGGTVPLDRTDVYNIENNIFLGQPSALPRFGGGPTCLAYFGGDAVTVNYTNNIVWNVKDNECPAGSICKDPKLKNQTMEHFDPTPLPGSPAINAAKPVSGVAKESHAQRNIGAIQTQTAWKVPKP